MSHGSAAAFVDAEARLFLVEEPIGPGDRVLAGLSVAFDASCEEMWLAWRHGACLVPAPRALVRTGVDLGPWLEAQRITIVSTVPTLAALWPPDALEDVRLLIFGGEACPAELAERVAVEGREVWNTYGPTEATVVACAAQLTGEGPVRIGLPLDGWALAVVDGAGEPVAMGESGELVIGGVGLARYLDAEKDAAKFAPLPSLGWARAYRSGDVVRAEEAGLLFLGRADEQVKLGGRRIELGEVDAALLALPGVRGAAAAVRRTRAGNQVLVGYVVPDSSLGTELDTDAAALALREQLPAALVPLLAVVDDLPTRTSGKVDRDALPWPLRDSTLSAAGGLDPVAAGLLTPTEGWLAEGWAEILGVAVTDPKADFFTHGGGSLTAAQLVARIRTRHPQVSVNDVYLHPTLGTLATRLDALSATRTVRRDVAPTPRRAAVAQALLMAPMLALVGLRWASVAAAISTVAAVAVPVGAPGLDADSAVVVARPGLAGVVQSGRADRDRRGRRPPPAARRAARQLPARRLGARAAVGGHPARRAVRCDGRLERVVDHPLRPRARREDRQRRRPALRTARDGPAQDRARRGRGAGGGPRRLLGRRRRRAHRQDPDRRRGHDRLAQHAAAGRADRQGFPRSRPGPRSAARSPPVSAGRARPRGGQASPACPGRRPARCARAPGRSPTASRRCSSGCCPRWRRCLRSRSSRSASPARRPSRKRRAGRC